jgi:regulation of enolase protein 1 (concanavalin A-like superfamily)
VDYNQVTHPGVLRIPADAGDLWAALNNTRNSLFRDIPTNWTSLRLKFSFAPTQNYQQAGLAVYQNDDNYVCVERIYNGGNKITCAREVGGVATVVTSASLTTTTNLYLRLDRNAATGTISAYYSLDGTSWVSVGSAVQTVNPPRVGIIADSSPGGFPNADFAWVEVIAPQSGPALAVSLQTLSFSAVQGAVGAALPGSGKIEPLIVSPDGQVRLTLRALAGQTFVIQASTNLESWDDLGTVNILGESAEFMDVNATKFQCRFYRAKLFKPAATASDVQNPSVGK